MPHQPATRDIPPGLPRPGCLYLVGTPIGNLEDITLRALRVLKEADLIACEDTRHTLKLLNHFEIRKRLISYHEHNEHTRAPELVSQMESGASIALVSDAGMPVVSDPGERLVRLTIEHGITVVPVPGPSALTAALAASGLPAGEFLFAGFLPAQQGKRRRALAGLAAEPRTLVFYEAPHRIAAMLADARATLGDRAAVIAREITKLHEEFVRGTLDELATKLSAGKAGGEKVRGEFTVLIAPDTASPSASNSAREIAGNGGHQLISGIPPAAGIKATEAPGTLTERVLAIQAETGISQKAALKQAAREFGLPRRDAYRRLLDERSAESPERP
jgi:16S rRNA (cytidine1402-2'-O)-methyltransferase